MHKRHLKLPYFVPIAFLQRKQRPFILVLNCLFARKHAELALIDMCSKRYNIAMYRAGFGSPAERQLVSKI